MSKIRVKQTRVPNTCTARKTMWGLGLRKMNKVKEHKDNNCIRGMINKVKHFVSYEIIEGK